MRRTAVARISATLAALAAFALPPTPSALAQVSLEVELDEFPMWLGPQDVLGAALRVTNRGVDAAENLHVTISIHEGIATRSHLERSFTGSLGVAVASDTVAVDGTIQPGETRPIAVTKPISEIGFFRTADDRAYPVRISVRSGRVSAPPIDTHMIFFSRPAQVPLSLALVVPINPNPIYNTRGQVTPPGVTRLVGEASALHRILTALESNPDARLTLAPGGLLIDSLADLANGYPLATGGTIRRLDRTGEFALAAQRAIERLTAVSSREEIRFAASSYSVTSLPWLADEGLTERVQAQFEGTRRQLVSILGIEALPGLAIPPLGILDEPSLTALSRAQVISVVVAPASLRTPDRRSLTRGAPVRLRTRSTQLAAVINDAALSSRLDQAERMGAVEARQRFLAESATIMLERPAQKRVVAVTASHDWNPDPKFLGGVLQALSRAPWMSGVTLDEALAAFAPAETLDLASAPAALSGLPQPPSGEYPAALRAANRAISGYADITPPQSRLMRLERHLAIAESSTWWESRRSLNRGLAFAESVEREVERELSKIQAPRPQTITLTSRTGVIPVVVTTSTDYPVRVVVRLESDKLEFDTGTQIVTVLAPPAGTIDIKATTQSSGTFPLRIVVETPNRGVELDSTNLSVRSTAYNLVAVTITGSAAVFLIGWWLVGIARRRIAS